MGFTTNVTNVTPHACLGNTFEYLLTSADEGKYFRAYVYYVDGSTTYRAETAVTAAIGATP